MDLIAAGNAALQRGAWIEAQSHFATAASANPSAAAFEGLGVAARYVLDSEAAFDAHREGFRLARAADDHDMAARLAVQLSYDAYAFSGMAEAIGWVERAAMLVEGRSPSFATAFVPFIRAYLALLGQHDPVSAVAGSRDAVRIARQVGAVDLELMAVALGGLALVAQGDVAPGMAKLDAAAAAAVGGEMSDVDSIETVCCFVIDACKRVRDLDRANEWCERVTQIADRFGDRQMFSICRVHHADLLLWRGDLHEAEAELEVAADELGRLRPGRDVDALVRLAEVRRRQGRTLECAHLLEQTDSHRLHALVLGATALDRGDATTAFACAERFLRRIGDDDRFERVAGLELRVRAALALGDERSASASATELDAIAGGMPHPALRASALLAGGRVAAAAGATADAAALVEDAADLFGGTGARFDAAQTRLELAGLVRALGDEARARTLEIAARAALTDLGAHVSTHGSGPLSAREVEVLRLLSTGLSNADIAHRLVLSVRTVERHVANVYAKVGAAGRTARSMATAWAHANGIA